MIKAIVFDCFGVLTVDLWQEFVSSLPESQRRTASDINHTYDAGLISESEFMSQIEQLTGRESSEVKKVRNSDGKKNGELLRYIATLGKDYKVGLLSNIASNWIRETLLNEEEQSLFDGMILSYEVGMTKPDPKIFELACERLGTQPNETVMIDDIEAYCQAATEVGMQAIVYQNFVQMKSELEKILG